MSLPETRVEPLFHMRPSAARRRRRRVSERASDEQRHDNLPYIRFFCRSYNFTHVIILIRNSILRSTHTHTHTYADANVPRWKSFKPKCGRARAHTFICTNNCRKCRRRASRVASSCVRACIAHTNSFHGTFERTRENFNETQNSQKRYTQRHNIPLSISCANSAQGWRDGGAKGTQKITRKYLLGINLTHQFLCSSCLLVRQLGTILISISSSSSSSQSSTMPKENVPLVWYGCLCLYIVFKLDAVQLNTCVAAFN